MPCVAAIPRNRYTALVIQCHSITFTLAVMKMKIRYQSPIPKKMDSSNIKIVFILRFVIYYRHVAGMQLFLDDCLDLLPVASCQASSNFGQADAV